MTTDIDTTKSALSVDQQQACSEFARPSKESWRWYAWTRMKRTEPMRWIATCWKGDTKEEAEGKRERALMEDVTLTLVCELTTYIPNVPVSQNRGAQNEAS